MRAFSKIFPFLVVIPCFFLVPLIFHMNSTLLIWSESSFGVKYLYVDFFKWFEGITTSVYNFSNSVSKFNQLELRFDSITHCLISICNIVIALVNTTLIPLSIVSNLLIVMMSLFGFPCDSSNFLYTALNVGVNIQIPYIGY